MVRVMIDTNIYDEFFGNKLATQNFFDLVRAGKIEFYGTNIQRHEINPPDVEQKEWELEFHKHAKFIPAQVFAYDVPGAGYDEAKFASIEDIELYKRVKGKRQSPNHIRDIIIALTACAQVDMLITNDKGMIKASKREMPNINTLSFNEFVLYMETL